MWAKLAVALLAVLIILVVVFHCRFAVIDSFWPGATGETTLSEYYGYGAGGAAASVDGDLVCIRGNCLDTSADQLSPIYGLPAWYTTLGKIKINSVEFDTRMRDVMTTA